MWWYGVEVDKEDVAAVMLVVCHGDYYLAVQVWYQFGWCGLH